MSTFKVYDTSLLFYKDDKEKDNYIHYKLLEKVFESMRTRGFEIEIDPETLKHYSSIAKDYFYGRKGDLEFKANRYPTGFEIKFYQNAKTEHKAGGYYDFDKFKKMPYLIRLHYTSEINKIIKFLKSQGYKNITPTNCKTAEDKVKQHLVKSWHHPENDMNFNLSDLDGTTCEYEYNNKDRDKKIIHNGDTKYFRDYNKYLCRGNVYHNINNMWWVIINDSECHNVASFELFDLTDEDRKYKGKLKTIKKYMNPKNKEYKNQEYRISDNIFIFNCRTGLFKANTDYGSYQYYWSPKDDYKRFLTELNRHYFLDKMSYGRELMEVDIEQTIKSWKEKIIEMRRDTYDWDNFNKDEARELWDFVNEELDTNMSSETLQRYMYDKCSDLDIEEPWYQFEVTQKYTDDVEKFYKLFCAFQDILKEELKEE